MKYITATDVWRTIPVRNALAHKGVYGKVLAIAGSSQYRGAAALCCQGALRCGAGLVTLASPENVIASIASQILEATFLPMPCENITDEIKKASVCVVGCGLLPSTETKALAIDTIKNAKQTILDAGALMSICDDLSVLRQSDAPCIITPHAGEMAALCGKSADEIQANRAEFACKFANEHNAIVVLKGHNTLIACPDNGEPWQNSTGGAGLARGGSGDILSGMIAAFCAMGIPALEAAKCAVYLHGHAADLCAARLSVHGMLPHDILTDICTCFNQNGK